MRRPLRHGFNALGRMAEDCVIVEDACAELDDAQLSRFVVDARKAIERAGDRMAILRRLEFPADDRGAA